MPKAYAKLGASNSQEPRCRCPAGAVALDSALSGISVTLRLGFAALDSHRSPSHIHVLQPFRQAQQTFKNLRGHGRLSESNISDALREVQLALLDADVHFAVAKTIAKVKERALGEEILKRYARASRSSKSPGRADGPARRSNAPPINQETDPHPHGRPQWCRQDHPPRQSLPHSSRPSLFSTMKGEAARTPCSSPSISCALQPSTNWQPSVSRSVPVYRPAPSEGCPCRCPPGSPNKCQETGGPKPQNPI